MNKAEFYREYLQGEGFSAEFDDDGDIKLKFEGRSYYVMANEDDEEYFCVLYNGFWRIESAEELQRALLHANDVTRSTKVAKVYVNREQTFVSASVELLLHQPDAMRDVFMRAMTVLQTAARKFRDKMQDSAPGV